MPLKVLSRCCILTICIFISFKLQAQQSDSTCIEIPDYQYVVERYDSTLQLSLMDYHYTDLWDFDNDGLMDEIRFISNGGAHCYYYPQIFLSSEQKFHSFKSFYIDMPYLFEVDEINAVIPFLVLDFDQDGVDEIYFNLNNHFASIPADLRSKGIKTKRILIDYENGELRLSDLKLK